VRWSREIIEAIPAGEELTLYKCGEFIDLCRGPHIPHTVISLTLSDAQRSRGKLRRVYTTIVISLTVPPFGDNHDRAWSKGSSW
jgi:threonyl-tRNA synthetase